VGEPTEADRETARKARVELLRCPVHGHEAISIGTAKDSMRITSGKCCGSWRVVKSWTLAIDARHLELPGVRDVAQAAIAAARAEERARCVNLCRDMKARACLIPGDELTGENILDDLIDDLEREP